MATSTWIRYAAFAFACAVVFLAICWLATKVNPSPPGHSQTHTGPDTIGSREPSDVWRPVSVQDGKLSLDVSDMPLRALLAEIGNQGHVEIRLAAEIGPMLMSARMTEKSLLDGLSTLLRDFDVLFLLQSAGDPASSLRLIQVYPKGGAQALMQSAPGDEVAANHAGRHGMSGDSTGKAGEEVTPDRSGPDGSLSDVSQGLQSPDPAVRQHALAKSFERQLPLPVQLLEQLARSDTDQRMRMLALVALAQSEGAQTPVVRAAIEAALGDSDPDVRQQAKTLLEQSAMAATPTDAVSQLSHH